VSCSGLPLFKYTLSDRVNPTKKKKPNQKKKKNLNQNKTPQHTHTHPPPNNTHPPTNWAAFSHPLTPALVSFPPPLVTAGQIRRRVISRLSKTSSPLRFSPPLNSLGYPYWTNASLGKVESDIECSRGDLFPLFPPDSVLLSFREIFSFFHACSFSTSSFYVFFIIRILFPSSPRPLGRFPKHLHSPPGLFFAARTKGDFFGIFTLLVATPFSPL